MTTIAQSQSQYTSASELSNLLESDKFGIYPAKTYLKCDEVTDDYDALYNLIYTTIDGDDAEIWFKDGTCLIGSNISIPSNVKLKFLNGGMIKIATDKKITGNGARIEAGQYKIFDLSDSGNVGLDGYWIVDSIHHTWFGALCDGSTDDTDALNSAIALVAKTGGVISISYDSIIDLDSIVFPDNISYDGNNAWVAGTRSNITIIMQGSNDVDDIFIPRIISHGFQSTGYWSGMRLSGGHNPTLVFEPKKIPIKTSITTAFQARDGNISTPALLMGRNGDGNFASIWQVVNDAFNDFGNEYEVRTRLNADKSALKLRETVNTILDSNTCTGGTTSTVIDSTKSWVVNAYTNKYVLITGTNTLGREMTQIRKIISNTATTLTIDTSICGEFYYSPDATYTYAIGDVDTELIVNQAVVTQITVNTVTWTTYAGNPENNVTANPGSICSDTTNGGIYLKTTGTSNTGWKAITHA